MRHNIFVFIMVAALTGCATTGAITKNEKRQAILYMKQETLSELYQIRPDARLQIAKAPGYAVFSNANINLILALLQWWSGRSQEQQIWPIYLHEYG